MPAVASSAPSGTCAQLRKLVPPRILTVTGLIQDKRPACFFAIFQGEGRSTGLGPPPGARGLGVRLIVDMALRGIPPPAGVKRNVQERLTSTKPTFGFSPVYFSDVEGDGFTGGTKTAGCLSILPSVAVTVSFFSAAGLPISGFASRAFGSPGRQMPGRRQLPAEPTRLAAKNGSVGVLRGFGEDDMIADPFALVGTMPEMGVLAGDGPDAQTPTAENASRDTRIAYWRFFLPSVPQKATNGRPMRRNRAPETRLLGDGDPTCGWAISGDAGPGLHGIPSEADFLVNMGIPTWIDPATPSPTTRSW